tara:strand:- start:45 stop:254 length:210 start_codon:yes stop_codon:yes gene_type:complete
MSTIYILELELEYNKYYIGNTADFKNGPKDVGQCWKDHIAGKASYCTYMYKPISIIKVIRQILYYITII